MISAIQEPTTTEPIDTMNLGDLPLVIKKEEEEEEEEEVDPTEIKLVLFPSQIHKISSLIALMAHKRDLLERLQKLPQGEIAKSIDWKSQLQYQFDKANHGVQVKVRQSNNCDCQKTMLFEICSLHPLPLPSPQKN